MGIAVYKMAKLRVCGFTTYCLDKFLHRCDYKLIEMDTDSLYLRLPAMAEKLRACKKEWFAWDKWSAREPGLFKLEFEGIHRIALCSKCCFMEDWKGEAKVSSMGSSKRQNKMH